MVCLKYSCVAENIPIMVSNSVAYEMSISQLSQTSQYIHLSPYLTQDERNANTSF